MRAIGRHIQAFQDEGPTSEDDHHGSAPVLDLDLARSRRANTRSEPPPPATAPIIKAVPPAPDPPATDQGNGRRYRGRAVAVVAAAIVVLLVGAATAWTLRPVVSGSAKAPVNSAAGPTSAAPTATVPAARPRRPKPDATKATTGAGAGVTTAAQPAGHSTSQQPSSHPVIQTPKPRPPIAKPHSSPPAAVPAPRPNPPKPSPQPVPRHASIEIQRADGANGPLGRDARLVGSIQGYSNMRCYWGGWEVRTASGWTGRFLKGSITPGEGGAFVLPNLQLGSDGETTSEWHAILLGGTTDAACTQLAANRKVTGEYTGPWPAPGVSVLYRGGAVRRAE